MSACLFMQHFLSKLSPRLLAKVFSEFFFTLRFATTVFSTVIATTFAAVFFTNSAIAKGSSFSPGFSFGYGIMRLPNAQGTAINKLEGTSPEAEFRLIIPSHNNKYFNLELFTGGGQFYGSGSSQNATVTFFGGGGGFTLGPLSITGGYWRNKAKITGGGYENSVSFPSMSATPAIRIKFSSKDNSSFLSLGCKLSKAVHNITTSGGTDSIPVTNWTGFVGVTFGLDEFF